MSNTTNDFSLRIGRYFRCLWYALTGRCVSLEEYMTLNGRIEKIYANVGKLQEMYCSALEKWEQASELAACLEGKGKKELASYQTLVETLRGTIRDKDKRIADLQRAYHDLLVSSLKTPEGRRDR